MRTFLAFAASLMLVTSGLVAAVEVASVGKRDTPIKISHESGEEINAIFVVGGAWQFLSDEHFIRGATETIMAAPPGEYLITTGESQILRVIEEGNPKPDPRPDPKPDPQPDPKPEPDPQPDPDQFTAEWVIWVEEINDRSGHQMQTNTMRDPELLATLRELGLKQRIYDKDQAAAASYLKIIDELPAMVILGEDPSNYRVFPAPMSVPEAEKAIRETILR